MFAGKTNCPLLEIVAVTLNNRMPPYSCGVKRSEGKKLVGVARGQPPAEVGEFQAGNPPPEEFPIPPKRRKDQERPENDGKVGGVHGGKVIRVQCSVFMESAGLFSANVGWWVQ